jgi:hypothetical protein
LIAFKKQREKKPVDKPTMTHFSGLIMIMKMPPKTKAALPMA